VEERIGFFTLKTHVALRKVAQWRAHRDLASRRALWDMLQEYLRQSSSTGCSYTDYWQLYHQIRTRKPTEVLECGTGVSTLVIAHALMENERDTGQHARLTSMEESSEWLEMSRRLLPEQFHARVDFCLSDTVEDTFSLFRGVRYRDVPRRPYDFAFIDGPNYKTPKNGVATFDLDFLHLLRTADHPMAGLVDKRVSTCYVLQHVLGVNKVRYSPVLHLGFIEPCTKSDLGDLQMKLSSVNFENSFKVFGETRLFMSPVEP
jgi:hypothetical protein